MKKLIVCAVLAVLTWVPCAHPATYYVRPDGDDGASGLSDAAAWKTTARVNDQTPANGDIFQFKRGGRWPAGATDEAIGTGVTWGTGKTVTYRAYGTGAKPVFDGDQMQVFGIQ